MSDEFVTFFIIHYSFMKLNQETDMQSVDAAETTRTSEKSTNLCVVCFFCITYM